MAAVWGRQVLLKVLTLLRNCNVPLESALAVLKVWSYSRKGKGRVMALTQSSQLEPVTKVVPGTSVEPVAVAIA